MEWTGAWSDKSAEWDQWPDIKAQLYVKDKDDGSFWMALPDFIQHFGTIFHN
jgi:hypothetical protein